MGLLPHGEIGEIARRAGRDLGADDRNEFGGVHGAEHHATSSGDAGREEKSVVLNDTAAMLAATVSLTNFEFGRNRLNKPNTSSTGGSFISVNSTTAWTGHCYDNYLWQLDGSSGIWIGTGTKLAFSQNFSPITGAADTSGLINPAAA